MRASPRRQALLLLAMLLPLGAGHARPVPVTDGMVIRGPVTLAPGTYRITQPLRVEADDLTLDLGGITLLGIPEEASLDTCAGTGLLIQGRQRVTLRGGTLQGFKVGILAEGCRRLTLVDCDVSRGYAQALRSTPQREATSDWLWPHHNDEHEWRERYGAGIYLDGCADSSLLGCTGHQRQNGILLAGCTGILVQGCDMSWCSGWGLALWRSSENLVLANRFDYCVRGYSHGVYHRGQDSAGILVFEQCSRNTFVANSATHGGDGFFLYAGHETTQRTGQGGSNHNLLYANDFSHAVANGIEATFSVGNRFIGNRLDDCDYGIWAGYSRETTIVDNRIRGSLTAGIAIEHGSRTRIEGNELAGNRRGIWLWWDEDVDLLASVYGQAQDTDSHGYTIVGNRFRGDRVAVRLQRTADVLLAGNRYCEVPEPLQVEGDCPGVRLGPPPPDDPAAGSPPAALDLLEALEIYPSPFLPPGATRGRHTIRVDGWGPVHPSTLTLFPSRLTTGAGGRLFLLGPPAPFQVAGLSEGFRVTPWQGTLPATLHLSRLAPGPAPFRLAVQVDGELLEAGGSLLLAPWELEIRPWPGAGAGQPPADWGAVRAGAPLTRFTVPELDLVWGSGAPGPDLPRDHFAVVATTVMPLDPGEYELRTVSDDGIRVRLDGEVVLENWTWHPPTENRATLHVREAGPHHLEVEHFEIDGHAQLQLELHRADAAPASLAPPFPVRVILLHPADQEPLPAYPEAILRCVQGVRAWYEERAGVSFHLLPLEVIRSPEDYLTMRCGTDPVERARGGEDPLHMPRWVEAIEAAVGGWRPRTATLVFAQGGGGVAVANLQGDFQGFAIVGDWVLEPISGSENPAGIPVSMCTRPIYVTGGTPAGTVAHELGHAFGLHHPTGYPDAERSVMQAHWTYPGGWLLPHEVLVLRHTPFTAAEPVPDDLPLLDYRTADRATWGQPFTIQTRENAPFQAGDVIELLDLAGVHTLSPTALTPDAITITVPQGLGPGLVRLRRGPRHTPPLPLNTGTVLE